MQVFIRFFDPKMGQTRDIRTQGDLSKSQSVAELKKHVAAITNVEPARQRLLFGGKQLHDSCSLVEYKINPDSTIHMSVRDVEVGQPSNVVDSPVAFNPPLDPNLELMNQEEDELCSACQSRPGRSCHECGCVHCGLKHSSATTLICDECNHYWHMECLSPPLKAVPQGDWYCPNCALDPSEIVLPGQKLKVGKIPNTSGVKRKRDWGRGMATAGRKKVCTCTIVFF